MTIAPETRLSTQNQFFFFWLFFVGKNLFLDMVMLEKVTNRGFLAFWPFENECKFKRNVKLSQKIWNLAKSEYYPPRHHWAVPLHSSCTARHSISNTSTTTGTSLTKPWNVRTYHYHTSYYVDHRFPIMNTNRFVIHRCEFCLCLNWTVLFICFMTEHETALCLRIIINWEHHRKNYKKILVVQFRFSVIWKKYSTIFNGFCPVNRENETIKHWKPPPVKYRFGH